MSTTSPVLWTLSSFTAYQVMETFPLLLAKTAVAPLERSRIVLQTEKSPTSSGPHPAVATLRKLVQTQGASSLWRGHTLDLIQLWPMQMLRYQLQSWIRPRLFNYHPHLDGYIKGFLGNWISGGLASACALLCVYPLTVLRVQLANDQGQTSGVSSTKKGAKIDLGGGLSSTAVGFRYKGIRDAFRHTLAESGVWGLYRGFIPAVLNLFAYRFSYFLLHDFVAPMAFSFDIFAYTRYGPVVVGTSLTSLAILAAYPFSTLSSRIIVLSGEDRKQGGWEWWKLLQEIVEEEGVGALFGGAGVMVLKSFVFGVVMVGYTRFAMMASGRA